jgi:hypothetical protein
MQEVGFKYRAVISFCDSVLPNPFRRITLGVFHNVNISTLTRCLHHSIGNEVMFCNNEELPGKPAAVED